MSFWAIVFGQMSLSKRRMGKFCITVTQWVCAYVNQYKLTFHVYLEYQAHLVPGIDLALVQPAVAFQDGVDHQLPGVRSARFAAVAAAALASSDRDPLVRSKGEHA